MPPPTRPSAEQPLGRRSGRCAALRRFRGPPRARARRWAAGRRTARAMSRSCRASSFWASIRSAAAPCAASRSSRASRNISRSRRRASIASCSQPRSTICSIPSGRCGKPRASSRPMDVSSSGAVCRGAPFSPGCARSSGQSRAGGGAERAWARDGRNGADARGRRRRVPLRAPRSSAGRGVARSRRLVHRGARSALRADRQRVSRCRARLTARTARASLRR